MSFNNVSNNTHSAMLSAVQSLHLASNNITETSSRIAQRSLEPSTSQKPDLSSELVDLSINSINAEVSAKVLRVADETLGTLLDIRA